MPVSEGDPCPVMCVVYRGEGTLTRMVSVASHSSAAHDKKGPRVARSRRSSLQRLTYADFTAPVIGSDAQQMHRARYGQPAMCWRKLRHRPVAVGAFQRVMYCTDCVLSLVWSPRNVDNLLWNASAAFSLKDSPHTLIEARNFATSTLIV